MSTISIMVCTPQNRGFGVAGVEYWLLGSYISSVLGVFFWTQRIIVQTLNYGHSFLSAFSVFHKQSRVYFFTQKTPETISCGPWNLTARNIQLAPFEYFPFILQLMCVQAKLYSYSYDSYTFTASIYMSNSPFFSEKSMESFLRKVKLWLARNK